MFCLFCSYDVIFTAGEKDILQKFLNFDSNVVISAEDFCWPDRSLAVSSLKRYVLHVYFFRIAGKVLIRTWNQWFDTCKAEE